MITQLMKNLLLLLFAFFAFALAESEKCTVCTTVAKDVEAFLSSNRTATKIANDLRHDVCNHMSGRPEFLCDLFAAELPHLLKWAAAHYNATYVCDRLHMCKNSNMKVPEPLVVLN